jgi:hypothetical protein
MQNHKQFRMTSKALLLFLLELPVNLVLAIDVHLALVLYLVEVIGFVLVVRTKDFRIHFELFKADALLGYRYSLNELVAVVIWVAILTSFEATFVLFIFNPIEVIGMRHRVLFEENLFKLE